MHPSAKRSIIKPYPAAVRQNAKRQDPLPAEMLPKTNRLCGHFGHDWEVLGTRKRCRRHLCEVTRPYKPNVFKRSEKLGILLSAYVNP